MFPNVAISLKVFNGFQTWESTAALGTVGFLCSKIFEGAIASKTVLSATPLSHGFQKLKNTQFFFCFLFSNFYLEKQKIADFKWQDCLFS